MFSLGNTGIAPGTESSTSGFLACLFEGRSRSGSFGMLANAVGAKGLVADACCNLLYSFLVFSSNDAFIDVDGITGVAPGSLVDACPFDRVVVDAKALSLVVLVDVVDVSWFNEGCDEPVGEGAVLPP